MRRLITLLLVGLFAITSGCLDYSEKLIIKKNGGGSMSVRISVDKEARAQAEEMADNMASAFGDMGGAPQEMDDPFSSLDEDRVRARLKEKGSKAKLKSYKKYDKGGDEVIEMEVSFPNGDALSDLAYALSDDDDSSAEIPFTYEKGSDGLWHYSRNQDSDESDFSMNDAPPGAMPGGMPDMGGMGGGREMPNIPGLPQGMDPSKIAEMSDEERQKMVDDMMAGLQESMQKMQAGQGDMEANFNQMKAKAEESMEGRKIRFEVHFPGKVVDSNATSVKGGVAIWEYPLSDVQHNAMPDEFYATVKQ